LSRLGVLQVNKIFICPSHDCNADCVHCYEKFQHQVFRESLTTEGVRGVIDQFHDLGGYFVYFCSGEFLARKDSLELIRYARDKDLAISVTTNGLLLDEKKIDELIAAGLTNLSVSIDSVVPERHDALRGVKGCFRKATEGIRIARRKGLNVRIWTYVSRSHRHELAGIGKLAKELDVEMVLVFMTLLSGHLFDRPEENLTLEERESLRAEFNPSDVVHLEFASEGDSCRGGGREHICVMPSGDVTFCPTVPYSYGNIAQDRLSDCLKRIREDYVRFAHCRGQCIVNFQEYRKDCDARFMYRPQEERKTP
jgi:MoaA/NifB/PqqE/SkfB family radical SAM enzyme